MIVASPLLLHAVRIPKSMYGVWKCLEVKSSHVSSKLTLSRFFLSLATISLKRHKCSGFVRQQINEIFSPEIGFAPAGGTVS